MRTSLARQAWEVAATMNEAQRGALEEIMPTPLPQPAIAGMLDLAVTRLADHLIALDNAATGREGIALERLPVSLRLHFLNDAKVIAASRNPRLRAIAESRVIERIVAWEEADSDKDGRDFTEAERQRVSSIAAEALTLFSRELLRLSSEIGR